MRTSPSKIPQMLPALLLGLLAYGPSARTCAQSPSAQSAQMEPKPDATPSTNSPERKEATPEASPPRTADPQTPEEVRHAELAADTKRLYELAKELRAEIAKTNKGTLSVAVVSKTKELEKLATNLKVRMAAEAASSKQ